MLAAGDRVVYVIGTGDALVAGVASGTLVDAYLMRWITSPAHAVLRVIVGGNAFIQHVAVLEADGRWHQQATPGASALTPEVRVSPRNFHVAPMVND